MAELQFTMVEPLQPSTQISQTWVNEGYLARHGGEGGEGDFDIDMGSLENCRTHLLVPSSIILQKCSHLRANSANLKYEQPYATDVSLRAMSILLDILINEDYAEGDYATISLSKVDCLQMWYWLVHHARAMGCGDTLRRQPFRRLVETMMSGGRGISEIPDWALIAPIASELGFMRDLVALVADELRNWCVMEGELCKDMQGMLYDSKAYWYDDDRIFMGNLAPATPSRTWSSAKSS